MASQWLRADGTLHGALLLTLLLAFSSQLPRYRTSQHTTYLFTVSFRIFCIHFRGSFQCPIVVVHFLIGHVFNINELLTKQFEPVLDLQRKNHWCRLHDKSRWGFAAGFTFWGNLHLPAFLEASTQRRVIPPTVQIQTTTSPQQNSAVKSSDGCNGGGPGHPQTFTSLIYYCPFWKNNSCKFITCLLFPLLKCFLNVSKYCSNAVV